MTPVSVSGGYWTGSSAVVDLLREHSECAVVDGEFTLFSFGQWFQEVHAPIVEGKLPDGSLLATNQRRFADFNKKDYYLLRAVGRRLCSYFRFYSPFLFAHRTGAGSRFGEPYASACAELSSLVDNWGRAGERPDPDAINNLVSHILTSAAVAATPGNAEETRIAVFDQIVAPPYIRCATAASANMKYINVDRDWRDQYISMRPNIDRLTAVNENLGVRPWDEHIGARFDSKIAYFVNLREKIESAKADFNAEVSDKKLWIDYEDVVLKTDSAAAEIFAFLSVDAEKWTPGTFLFPAVSRQRIGKWRNLDSTQAQLARELDQLGEILGLPDR